MHLLAIAAAIFGCLFAAAFAAMSVREHLPEQHLNDQSKDAVKVGMAMIVTMTALVLGLLVASTKSSYDTQNNESRQIAARISQLDQVLAEYGPETKELRASLHGLLAGVVDQLWRKGNSRVDVLTDPSTVACALILHRTLLHLAPTNDAQRSLRDMAVQIAGNLSRIRWQLVAEAGSSIPLPFLIILVFWLTVLFASFGLFAPRNATVLTALGLGALSVAGALFLILELDHPFEGMMQITSEPIRVAIDRLARP